MSRHWDVFLAYASPDRDRARGLYQAMVSAGLRVCFDQGVLRPGDNWHRELPGHLRASAVVVALLSTHTADAMFETAEVLLGLGQVRREGGRLVPVRLSSDAVLPYGTEALHALDLFDDTAMAGAVAAIVDVVRHPSDAVVLAGSQVWCGRVPTVPAVFAGRDALLERLRGSTAGGGAVLTQTVQGMGGVGKTTVAAALAEALRHNLDVVWWVRAEQPEVLVADLAELASRVGVAVDDDPAVTARAVRDWLETTPRSWLVVFDNAADEASVEPWRPHRGGGATVVTSRNRNMGRIGEVITVDTFPAEVAEAFLRDRVAKRNPVAAAEDVSGVLARLGGLVLALEQAAAWVERVPSRRFARYQALYDAVSGEPFPDGTRPLDYDHTATTAWRVSIDAATAEAPCAARVLAVAAFLGPDDLPCVWLRDLADAGDDYLDATAGDVDDALAALHGYSLAEISDTDTVSVHRVIQHAARHQAPGEAAGSAIALLRAQVGGDARDHTRWAGYAVLVPHALAAAATTGAALPGRAGDLWRVLNDLTVYHYSRGATADAIKTGILALDFATTQLGADHPDTLASRNNLAYAYESAGDLGRAMPLLEANLADSERVLGSDHPSTLASRNNLAYAYEAAGDLGRAVPLLEATLADRERVLGADHPSTLTSRNNLAGAYESAGDLGRAVPLFEANLADCERVLGADHPDTLASRNDLAGAYRAGGDLGRAVPLLEVTLADRERVLGADHPDTLASRNNLAYAYESAGDLGQAVPLLEATVADLERVLGADHPSTLTSRDNLAYAYEAAGDLGRAVPLFEANLADRERVLGADHPSTLASRNNLAYAYESAGDLGRAVPLFEATVADLERVLGADHPSTLTSRNNLAYAYEAAGDLGRAVPQFEATLADRERVLGADHPDTLTSRNNLAGAYRAAGDLGRAVPLLEANLADFERVLGPDHPHTLTGRDNLELARRSLDDSPGRS